MVKAKRVPIETKSARMSRGTKKARVPMMVPVMTVATMGLWVRGLTRAYMVGNRYSSIRDSFAV
jgi:hypothetical protein